MPHRKSDEAFSFMHAALYYFSILYSRQPFPQSELHSEQLPLQPEAHPLHPLHPLQPLQPNFPVW